MHRHATILDDREPVGLATDLRDKLRESIEPQQEPGAPLHFAFVDALRGFAILGVLVVHVCRKIPDLPEAIYSIGIRGAYGVQLFFVISSFTLFWSLRSRVPTERHPWRAYFARRFFRIAPLFWTGAIFYLFWVGRWRDYAGHGIAVGSLEVLSTFLFVHGWHPATYNSLVPGGWSIACEAMFYFALPAMFVTMRSLRVAVPITLVATLLAGLLIPWLTGRLLHTYPDAVWSRLIEDFVYCLFPAQWAVFCMGCLLYLCLTDTPDAHKRAALLFGAVGLVALFALRLLPEHILFATVFAAIAYGLAKRPVRLLVNPITCFIGKVSFSIYIWHFWLLERLRDRVPNLINLPDLSPATQATVRGAALFVVLLLLSTAVATLSFYLIEQPGQTLGKAVIRQLGWGRKAAKITVSS